MSATSGDLKDLTVLVVEDDPVCRRILAHLVTRDIGCNVVQATNGLEGLCAVERHDPDLVLLDTLMPVMDGITMLEAIRESPAHSSLPVISVSSVSERATVLRLVGLGIVDYIVKPLDRQDACRRITAVLASMSRRTDRGAASGGGAAACRKLVIVDHDAEFCAYAREVLRNDFEVGTASSGAEALQLLEKDTPDLLCIAEGLPLLNERLLSTTIRRLQTSPPIIGLLTDRTTPLTEAEQSLFDAVIAKSRSADTLKRSILRCIDRETIQTSVAHLLHEQLRPEIIACTQHAIALLTNQVVEPDDDATNPVLREIEGRIELIEEARGLAIDVFLYGTRNDLVHLSQLALDHEFDFDEGAWDVLARYLETIGARIRSAMQEEGLQLNPCAPIVRLPDEDGQSSGQSLALPFRCRTGQRFVLVVDFGEVLQGATPT